MISAWLVKGEVGYDLGVGERVGHTFGMGEVGAEHQWSAGSPRSIRPWDRLVEDVTYTLRLNTSNGSSSKSTGTSRPRHLELG